MKFIFFFSSRRRHTRLQGDWSSDVCSSDLVVVHHHDITELKAMTEAVQGKREEISATLDSIGDGLIATDREGRVTRMNPVAEKLTGWTLSEAAGCSLGDVFRIVAEDTRARIEDPVAKVLQGGAAVRLS